MIFPGKIINLLNKAKSGTHANTFAVGFRSSKTKELCGKNSACSTQPTFFYRERTLENVLLENEDILFFRHPLD